MSFPNRSRGFTIIGLLLALVIIMILMGHYFKKDEVTEKTYIQTQLDKSTDVACTANRQVLGTHIIAWSIAHPGEKVSSEKLTLDRVNVPHCPDGPEYIFETNGEVYCPKHAPFPTQPRAEAQAEAGAILPGSSANAPAAGTVDRAKRQLGQ
jgi:competence protein ComGC